MRLEANAEFLPPHLGSYQRSKGRLLSERILEGLGLAGDLVEIIREIHAESGRVDGAIDDLPEFSGVVNDRENFLHSNQGENGNQKRSAPLDRIVDGSDEARDFMDALFADRPLSHAASRFRNEGIEMPGGEFCAGDRALIFEEHVASEKYSSMLVPDLNSGCARDMAGVMKNNFDFVPRTAKAFGVAELQSRHSANATVDLVVGEKGIVRDVFIFALPHHHVGGIVQHAFNKHAAPNRHDHRRIWMLPHHHGQTANVVQVAVRDDDQIQRRVAQRREVWRRRTANFLGMEPAIDENAQIANLYE